MTPYTTTEGRLPLRENTRIFHEHIAPAYLTACTPQRAPTAVIIAGQTGAGKTAVTRMVSAALRHRGRAAWINMDFYNPHHPDYARWQAERPQEADALVRPDGDRWWQQAQEHALSQGFDILLESAMVSTDEYEDICRRIQSARLPRGVAPYRIETAFIATPAAFSRLGVTTRYLDQVDRDGHGRLVDPDIHDAALRGVFRGATAFERDGLGDFATVLDRTARCVHSATFTPGHVTPADRLRLVHAVRREHARTRTPAEAAQFAARHALAVLAAPDGTLPELRRISRLPPPSCPDHRSGGSGSPHSLRPSAPIRRLPPRWPPPSCVPLTRS